MLAATHKGDNVPSLRDSVEAEIEDVLGNAEAALQKWGSMSIDHIDPGNASEVADAALRWAAALHVAVLRLAEQIDVLKTSA